jgi:hypothetical protein
VLVNGNQQYKVLVVNSVVLGSEIGNYLCGQSIFTQHNADFVAVFNYSFHANETRVSLRTVKSDVDLSWIAANIVGVSGGGGGHQDAAGFAFKGCDFQSVFKIKPL